MNSSIKIKFLYSFISLLFLADLLFIYLDKTNFRFISKNLLMPVLLFTYLSEAKSHQIKLDLFFILGLFFSFLGDFFLLLKSGFLLGLGSFLLAHIFYIISFKKRSLSRVSVGVIVVLLLYLVSLISFLFPHLKEMKIPVIIYGIIISTMLYFSIKTQEKLLIVGALFFVISDSVLSVNLFVSSSLLLNLLVMITYVFAQVLLVKGILKTSKTYS